MNKNLICGGAYDATRTCIQLKDGEWTISHTLLSNRARHVSWEVDDGVILMGGYEEGSQLTSELVRYDGGVEEAFPLKYVSNVLITGLVISNHF